MLVHDGLIVTVLPFMTSCLLMHPYAMACLVMHSCIIAWLLMPSCMPCVVRLADLMDEHKEELATLESIDSGAVYTLALKTHIGMSIDTFR